MPAAAEGQIGKPFGCVYLITNNVNAKVYVGQTRRSASERWSVHKSEAKKRPGCYFHKAIRKYGDGAFVVRPLEYARDIEELNRLEQKWIAELSACSSSLGYNQTSGGDSYIRTVESRRRMSDGQRGRRCSVETRRLLSEIGRGRKHSPMHTAKIAAALKGRIPSLQCRIAVAEANRRRVPSQQTRVKLRAAALKANRIRWHHQPE